MYFIVVTVGRIIIISISKIKNKIAIIKKWIENGSRLLDMGLNPHSKGDDFCLSIIDFFLIVIINVDIAVSSTIIIIAWIIVIIIVYFLIEPFSWKLNIHFILNKHDPHQ